MKALLARMGKIRSPVKQAALVDKATTYLTSTELEDCAYMMIGCHSASRSASLCFATFNASRHRLVGVTEEGISIRQHLLSCDRNGRSHLISDTDFAYVSKHAIGRLHEREVDLTRDHATSAIGVTSAPCCQRTRSAIRPC